ncbi:uncharacterized protein DS421_1g11950 [Arachis hypogaea]|nr:uncharacterized protein DS421_1g11950 [Arachis hypogaea]
MHIYAHAWTTRTRGRPSRAAYQNSPGAISGTLFDPVSGPKVQNRCWGVAET